MNLFCLIIVTTGSLAFAGAKPLSPSPRHASSATIPPIATQYGTVFDAPVTIGNQTFMLLVDTGSSDTYVMQTGFTCINSTSNLIIPEGDCEYSQETYRKSKTYRKISNEIFGVEYGAGLASGSMVYEEVSIGGITVKSQKTAIANDSNPMGDGVNSGLLGLAYLSITSAHPANQTDNSTYWQNRLVYNPLLLTMHEEGLIDPYFSLALAHTPLNTSVTFGGYMTIGGLPRVDHSPHFSTVPVEITDNIPLWYTPGKKVRSY